MTCRHRGAGVPRWLPAVLVLAAAGAVLEVVLLSAAIGGGGGGGGPGPDPVPRPIPPPTVRPTVRPVSPQVAVCGDGTRWSATMPGPVCCGHGGVRFWTGRIPGSPDRVPRGAGGR